MDIIFIPDNVVYQQSGGANCPEYAVWQRAEFLAARSLQTEAAKQAADENTRVIDCGENILCDRCCDEEIENSIIVHRFGREVACQNCLRELKSKGHVSDGIFDQIINFLEARAIGYA